MTKHAIEVITSVERRRRWSREDKERLVAACFEPDAVISEIARAAGIHVSQLFRWRKELCRLDEPQTETGTVLVPVIVSEAISSVSPIQPGAPTTPHPRRKRSDVTIDQSQGHGFQWRLGASFASSSWRRRIPPAVGLFSRVSAVDWHRSCDHTNGSSRL